MNKAQKYLLDNNLNDVIISNPNIKDPEKWIYVSDIMMIFKNGFPHCKGGKTPVGMNKIQRLIKGIRKSYYKKTFWGFTICTHVNTGHERGGTGISSIACHKCSRFISDNKEESYVLCHKKEKGLV